MMSNNSHQLSFWKLIQNSKIEIPIIQRDYAQGRADRKEVRENFLNALFNALENDKKLELDFVYGDIKSGVFQPLDGQQRLTTLFLLHWYVATKENKLDESTKETLSKFKYETRASSREFCTALIKENDVDFENLLPADSDKENELSITIIDRPWFFLAWQKDPTIKAMLIMLDAIHKKFSHQSDLWRKLTEQETITFHHLQLNDFGLSDDLYIKMNARGKALTEFENFKAKFEQYITQKKREEGLAIEETFAHKIDTAWTDLFWKYRNKDQNSKDFNLFDKEFMNFFRVMAINHFALKGKDSPSFRENIELLRAKGKDVPFSKYVELGVFDEDYFAFIKSILDKLSKDRANDHNVTIYLPNSPYVDEKELFNKAISNDLISYADLITLHAYYQYLAKEENIENKKLAEWMRVVRNLVEGSRPYNFNDEKDLVNALKSISELFHHRNDILGYLKDTNQKNLPGLLGNQFEEEKLKAKLILESEEWKIAILSAENHGYFNGQIGFLINWSCIEGNSPDLPLFLNYWKKATLVFENDGLKQFDGFLFQRALLAKGNYLLKKGQNHSFLVDKDREISWKRLLRDENEGRRDYLKSLLDGLPEGFTQEDLQSVVSQFKDKTDWRYHFIKQPEIIKACGDQKFIRWYNERNILLMKLPKTSSYHQEYYSYALALSDEMKSLVETKELNYKPHKSVDITKCFEITKNDTKHYVAFKDAKYVYLESKEYPTEKTWAEACNESENTFETEAGIINRLKEKSILN